MELSAGLAMVIMGVSGSGKSTIGHLLANSLGCDFLDADDFHSAENKENMRQGITLTDSDRLPWLETLRDMLIDYILWGKMVILACSALKPSYRSILRTADFEWMLEMQEKDQGDPVSKEHAEQGEYGLKEQFNKGSDELSRLKTRTKTSAKVSEELSRQAQEENGCVETSENSLPSWRRVLFLFLSGPKELFASRLEDRYKEGTHFMPPSLLQSQIDSLHIGENEKDVIFLDASMKPEVIVEHIKGLVSYKAKAASE